VTPPAGIGYFVEMAQPDGTICSVEELRQQYASPVARSVRKTLPALDVHMRRFIELSPLVCLGTSGEGGADVTPRGDQPGFVHVPDGHTLLIPDWPGNNRLDSLTNIVGNPNVGLLFFIPGVTETLRVNGTASITTDPALREQWNVNGRQPKAVVRVAVQQAFLHCGKALHRSKLWQDDYRIERSVLPSYGTMLKDQVEMPETAEELQAYVDNSYKTALY
jgi:PPOX class probable FMN-dependent enzyme